MLVAIIAIYISLLGLFYFQFTYHGDVMSWNAISWAQISESKVSYMTATTMLSIRGLFAIIIWGSIAHICTDKEGLKIVVALRDGSQKPLHLKYYERLTMFTVWSWILQGIYFAGTSIAGIVQLVHQDKSSVQYVQSVSDLVALNTLKILYEVSFPVSFMVSLIVSFILIPAAKKLNGSADNFFAPMALLFHNANVLFMVFEMLSNRIPLTLSHLPFMLMYGMAYSAFAWYWYWLRGVYYYFFMDYHRGDAIYWYVGLMVGFSVFYLLSHEISFFIHQGSAGIIPHVVVLGLAWISMKVRDDKPKKASD